MQRSSRLQRHKTVGDPACGFDLPQSTDQISESSQFCFNAAASPFDPLRPPIAAQNEFVQDLFAWWSWEGEDRSAKFLTFFVDHRGPLARFDHGRDVHLFEDYHHWEEQILRAWSERVEPGQEIEFQLVHPQPPLLYVQLMQLQLLLCRHHVRI